MKLSHWMSLIVAILAGWPLLLILLLPYLIVLCLTWDLQVINSLTLIVGKDRQKLKSGWIIFRQMTNGVLVFQMPR